MTRTITAAALLLVCASTACVVTSPDDLATQDSLDADRVVEPSVPEGVRFNGIKLDGTTLGPGAFDLVAGEFGALQIHNLSVSESGFVGEVDYGDGLVAISGEEFIGARLYLEAESVDGLGQPITNHVSIYINDIYPTYTESPILAHQVEVYQEAAELWVDACDNGGMGLIPLLGAWDSGSGDALGGQQVTLACRDAALAKCTEWGYWPWAQVYACDDPNDAAACEWVDLGDLHQACTRMLRADYCGDGTTHTLDGTAIDVSDSLNIEVPVTNWVVEAEWGPEGATCLGNSFRYSLMNEKPSCIDEIEQLPLCGSFQSESRLASRYGTF